MTVTGYSGSGLQLINYPVSDDWYPEMSGSKCAAASSFPSRFNSLDQLANTLRTALHVQETNPAQDFFYFARGVAGAALHKSPNTAEKWSASNKRWMLCDLPGCDHGRRVIAGLLNALSKENGPM